MIWGKNAESEHTAGASTLGGYNALSSVLELSDSITAVDFAPCLVNEK